ncbi:MAG: prolyl aminopeptidase [Alphaproteobacteria bacterium]|nr:prolyl aminopeptidase [Alphaproteobacteria bacterium]
MPHRKAQKHLELFPATTPYSSGFLSVENDTHQLYWEQSGNPDGVPIIFLHGGPGAGATPTHRRFFDPEHYRIIIFDQRGSGRSHPLGSLENNTTAHLVADIETLRKHLKINRWHVFGGSWGSTLALSYATQHPKHCLSLILRGIFLCEQTEIDWFLYGMKNIFPESWETFASIIPADRHNDLLNAYYERLTDPDPEIQMQAGLHWSAYEGACSLLIPKSTPPRTDEERLHALALARIEAHYFKHHVIAPENSLLNKVKALRAIPSSIIQGRYDVICPIITAHQLHDIWPEADYIIIPNAGHSALDPALQSALIQATEHAKTISDEFQK